uniref:ethanolamine-phosphate cytidylyltransferase n=1 Tax=viral metagenome TaxID=1070528 RepID=A0A6C0DR09_9ZZZZ
MIHYANMVADLFHYGHVDYIKQIASKKQPGDLVYIGIHSDETTKAYKRTPVMSMEARIRVVEACRYVDRVIPNSPLTITKDYIDQHKIDYIYIPDNRTTAESAIWYSYPMDQGIIRVLEYTSSVSTTDIIKKIRSDPCLS